MGQRFLHLQLSSKVIIVEWKLRVVRMELCAGALLEETGLVIDDFFVVSAESGVVLLMIGM